MVVLVDEARWWWRGTTWAHLVSDESYDELHAFAQGLGKRRLGFQGDHYDIDEIDRGRAIERGAAATSSRHLVGRLRESGLRQRDAKPRWERVAEFGHGDGGRVRSQLAAFETAGERLAEAMTSAHKLVALARGGLYVDSGSLVLLLDLAPGVTESLPPVDVDEAWVGGPRVDGWRSVEFVVHHPPA